MSGIAQPSDGGQVGGLLDRARRGNQGAFAELCSDASRSRWLLAITGTLPSYLRCKVDAEDVLQDVLSSAWRSIENVEGENAEDFHRWVSGILRNKVTDTIRFYGRRKREAFREEGHHTSPESKAYCHRNTPSKSAFRHEQIAKIAEVLDLLKEPYRQVIVHRVLEGCSTREVAEIMGKETEHVNILLYRALRKLKGILQERGIESTLFRPL
ncbi:MAG: sigma-70 family RNA polymerase sigma factor [Phycisphaerae bacterium]|nr:sigma-70 family RNA polymerase sigma factor [Phycisphaerae bacterium]